MTGHRRPIALLLLVCWLPACATYRATDVAPEVAVIGQRAVKVTLADAASTEVTVVDPWVRADSIGGMVHPIANWSVPLSSVVEVKTKRSSALLTGIVVGGIGLAALAGYFIACAGKTSYVCP